VPTVAAVADQPDGVATVTAAADQYAAVAAVLPRRPVGAIAD
jgi:hypothetical protein